MQDELFIKRTISLAKKGMGLVSPNPLVGSVIVKDGTAVAEGYHHRFGKEHAEVNAIRRSRENLAGATLFVNLEPCSHYGRQPPCVHAIVNAGIKEVVIGIKDPNPQVNGRGIDFLVSHGIHVRTGVLEEACRALNQGFIKAVTTGLPYVTLKIAQTLDGRIAGLDGKSKWITNEASRKYVHRMRRENDAVLVGIGTVLIDDPQLDVRLVRGISPKRIVLDSRLRISEQSLLLREPTKTIVVTSPMSDPARRSEIQSLGAEVWTISEDSHARLDLAGVCRMAVSKGIHSILVEGGSAVFSSFIKNGLVDEVAVFIAPKILGDGLSAIEESGIAHLSSSLRLHQLRNKRFDDDVLIQGKVKKD